MSRFPLLATALGALVAATPVAPASAAGTPTSHARLWQSPNGNVVCGIEIHLAGRPAKQLLCSAKGIPRPKHQGGVGDPFAQISAKGPPQVVLVSQRSFLATRTTKLKPGTLWSSLGVFCGVGTRTVTCVNRYGHGFTIGNGAYKSFHRSVVSVRGKPGHIRAKLLP